MPDPAPPIHADPQAGEPGRPRAAARLCVMISGGGRTALNLQDEIDAGRLPARIELVIASRPCAGLDRCLARGLDAFIVRGRIPRDVLGGMLRSRGIDLVVLAGYLHLVDIPPGYEGRIVNIHPALLPAHGGPGMYGDRVHEAVLAAGERESGCTVHLCDGAYDRGPILLQRRCAVAPGDDAHALAARVFELEKQAYPQALRELIARLPET